MNTKISFNAICASVLLLIIGMNVNAQSVSVQIYPLQEAANDAAKKLAGFYEEGLVIEKTNFMQNEKIDLQLVCCDGGTIKIYLPEYDATGDRIGCHCPVLTLHSKGGNYYTEYMPDNEQVYSEKETVEQKEIIETALAFLK